MCRFFLSVGGLAFLGNNRLYEAIVIVNCNSYYSYWDLVSSGISSLPNFVVCKQIGLAIFQSWTVLILSLFRWHFLVIMNYMKQLQYYLDCSFYWDLVSSGISSLADFVICKRIGLVFFQSWIVLILSLCGWLGISW